MALRNTATAKIEINTVYDSVRQREADWFYEYVSSSSFDVYLIWDNPSNSLTLTHYSPDGSVYGERVSGVILLPQRV